MTTTTTTLETFKTSKKIDFEVKPATRPTMEEVRQDLQSENLDETPNAFRGELYTQWTELMPVAIAHEAALREAGYPHIRLKLVQGYRLAELAGYAVGERPGITVDTTAATPPLNIRRALIARRDALVRMARDARVPETYFQVNFGEGNAPHVLMPATALLTAVKVHGSLLLNQVLVRRYEREIEDAVKMLGGAEIAREVGKDQATFRTEFRDRCRHALYEILLHVSRAGLNTFLDDPRVQEEFRLKVLRPAGGGGALAVDDDDAPIASAIVNAAVPAGTVTAVAEWAGAVRTRAGRTGNDG